MDIHDAIRNFTSKLHSSRRTPEWKEGYLDAILNSGYCGGYGDTKRKMYTQGFEVGVEDRLAWLVSKKKATT